MTNTSATIVKRHTLLAALYALPVAGYAVSLAGPVGTPVSNAWIMAMTTLGTTLILHAALLLGAAGGMHHKKREAERDGFVRAALFLLLLGVPVCFVVSWVGMIFFGR